MNPHDLEAPSFFSRNLGMKHSSYSWDASDWNKVSTALKPAIRCFFMGGSIGKFVVAYEAQTAMVLATSTNMIKKLQEPIPSSLMENFHHLKYFPESWNNRNKKTFLGHFKTPKVTLVGLWIRWGVDFIHLYIDLPCPKNPDPSLEEDWWSIYPIPRIGL